MCGCEAGWSWRAEAKDKVSRKKTWQSHAMSKVEGSGKAVVEVRCRFNVLRGFGS